MHTPNSFTFILPNYNGADVLAENLPKIISLSEKYHAPIILIDDFSKDNSVEWLINSYQLQDRHSRAGGNPSSVQYPSMQSILTSDDHSLTLITKTHNEGFSSTVNLGVAHATTELILLLNTDAVPHPDAIDKLLPYFTDPQTFSVGMKDVDDDAQTHGQGKFIFHEGFLLHNKGDGNQDATGKYQTGWVSCGSGLFRKSIWDQLGGLDPLFNPFYFEDVDLGYRATKAGYLNYFEPQSRCDHLHQKGAIKSNYNDDRIRTISIRNQYLFTWLNLTDQSLIQQHMLAIPRHLLRSIAKYDKPFLQGTIEAIKRLGEVRSRRQIRLKQSPKFTDQDIIKSETRLTI